jgi:tRNA(Arg) A34 adenosine deaminase TadA
MKDKRNEFMKEALRLASENLEVRNGGPFGCVIVKEGEIIATGYNEVLFHDDPTCHAEIVAIRKACKKLKSYHLTGCEIYSSCEPCPMCMGAIFWARLDKLYYSTSRYDAEKAGFDDNFIYKELKKAPSHRSIPGEKLLNAEGVEIFHRWKKLNLKIKY